MRSKVMWCSARLAGDLLRRPSETLHGVAPVGVSIGGAADGLELQAIPLLQPPYEDGVVTCA